MNAAAVNPIANDRLNDLVIHVGRSLLQYTSESWPWAANQEVEIHRTLDRLAAEQRDVVAALVALLFSRGHILEFGAYPTEYTSWHYVSVDFLLGLLVANQADLLRECEAVDAALSDDPAAKELLDDVLLSERKHLEELQALAESRGA